MVSDGTNTLTYDNNGNMTSDGVSSYTWDRANRLLTWDNGVAADLVNHAYDGEGRRVSQAVGTTSPEITKYLLDIQPGLAVVLSQTEGIDVTRFIHAPRGIHARQDATNDWHWTVQDGLSTVRVETNNSVVVEGSQNLDPFGNLIDLNGTIETPYGFTGELVDGSGLLDLRARRYNAELGVFASLDPFEGGCDRAMSLNRYSWVEGNVPNAIDSSGMQIDPSTLVASQSDFTSELPEGGVGTDGKVQYVFNGRSIKPRRAREKFLELQLYTNIQKGMLNLCNPLEVLKPTITYEDMLAVFVGGEMGTLNQGYSAAFDAGVEAVGRYYWDYTVDNLNRWDFVNTEEGFQGNELWALLGDIHSYDQSGIDEMYGYMQNPSYRAKAREIISGQTNGQDIRNGFNAVGRPINWGNNGQIGEPALSRLIAATTSGRLVTNSSDTGTYYEGEGIYVYNVWQYLDTKATGKFVLWSYGQQQCLRREGAENVPPSAGSGCKKCTGTRKEHGTCEYV